MTLRGLAAFGFGSIAMLLLTGPAVEAVNVSDDSVSGFGLFYVTRTRSVTVSPFRREEQTERHGYGAFKNDSRRTRYAESAERISDARASALIVAIVGAVAFLVLFVWGRRMLFARIATHAVVAYAVMTTLAGLRDSVDGGMPWNMSVSLSGDASITIAALWIGSGLLAAFTLIERWVQSSGAATATSEQPDDTPQ